MIRPNRRDKSKTASSSSVIWFLTFILLLSLVWLLWSLSFLFDGTSIKTSKQNNHHNENIASTPAELETQHDASNEVLRLRHLHLQYSSTLGSSNNHESNKPNNSITSGTISAGKSVSEIVHDLFEMGVSNPRKLVDILENSDPLNVSGDPDMFSCPDESRNRIDFPILYNAKAMEDFRDQIPNSFIFYQHLRKAGGTAFCSAAQQNLEHQAVPPYYCMPDNRGSLATPPWNSAEFLLRNIREKGYRIVANEWDAFYESFFDLPGAVFATTFRHPIDRWYSQYRFEHLEHRDGSSPGSPRTPMLPWYNNQKGWTMGMNYYVTTFIGDADFPAPTSRTGDFYWTYHKFQHKKIDFPTFNKAVQNLRKFHLVLITEWLERSAPVMNAGLGWRDAPKQVLPHEVQAPRKNKANVPSKQLLSSEDYDTLAQENVFDLLLFAVAKRIFLERSKCIK